MKRVLYFALVEFDLPGGPVVHTVNMIKGFRELGVECTVVCPQPGRKPPELEGVRWIFVRPFAWTGWKWFITNLVASFQLLRAIRHSRPDLLYFRDHVTNTIPCWVARAAGIPLVIELNGRVPEDFELPSRSWRGLRARLHRLRRVFQFGTARGMTFNSPGLRDVYVDEYSIDRKATEVVSMHVDSDVFFPRPRKDCRQELALPEDSIILGYVGTFHPSHEFESALDAVRRLNRSGIKCMLLMVGDGERLRQILNSAERMGIADSIICAGWVPHSMVSVYLSAMDLGLAFLSQERGFAVEGLLKVKEYLACGIPVLVNSGYEELFADYPEGSVIPVDTSEAVATGPHLAQVVRRCADHRDTLVARAAGARFIQENFGLATAAAQTLEVSQ